ncbi:MAG: squalene/phytoene synthase family protein [Pseudomonadota bacterium]
MTSLASDSLTEIVARLDARLRRVDEERWLSSRYASDQDRHTLIILYAFYYELARVRLAVSDQTMGQIRFQWWRDALDQIAAGTVRDHDLVQALADQITSERLTGSGLMRLIDQHQEAFLRADRGLEPESDLASLAANLLSPKQNVSDLIALVAPDWARLRRGEAQDHSLTRAVIASDLRPALAHFRLRHAWAKGRSPGPIRTRLSILRAMLSGVI